MFIDEHTATCTCTNELCVTNESSEPETFELLLTRETEGAAPPYGPPNGLNTYWILDDPRCPECGAMAEEI